MDSDFRLDPCHRMIVRTSHAVGNPPAVSLTVTHTPLPPPSLLPPPGTALFTPAPGVSAALRSAEGATQDHYAAEMIGPASIVCAFTLRPSEARAIASAILSAATEAKGV